MPVTKPTPGGSNGTWGAELNAALTELDTRTDPATLSATYARKGHLVANVAEFGAVGDGVTDDSEAIQDCIDAVMALGGGGIFFPHGVYKASSLTASGVLSFFGEGGADIRGGTWATTQCGSALTPAVANQPVITIASSKRLIWRDLDFVHDRSFKADAMILGSTPGAGVGTFWPDLNVAFKGFDGHALKVIGVFWECDLANVHARQCGDGTNDKAAIEIDGTPASSDLDTVRFSAPNVTFPRAVGFRLKSSANSASAVSVGAKRLIIDGGMFHAGLNEDNVGGANRYDADMIVIDGFTSLIFRDVNVASVAAARFALRLDGSLTTNGSNRAIIEGNQFNGPIRVGKCKDVTIGRNGWAYWIPGEYNEHIFVDAAAVRTTITEQTVLNDGVLVITDNSTTTRKPLEETLLISAMELTASTGSPTLSRASSRFPAWLLDAATVEQVNAGLDIPSSWRRFNVEAIWSNVGPGGSGDVRWQLGYSVRNPGDALTAGDVFPAAVVGSVAAVDVEVVTTLATAVNRAAGLWHLRVSRQAADATDTLGSDAALMGLRLRRTA